MKGLLKTGSILSKLALAGTVVGGFSAGLASTYFTVENKTEIVDLGGGDEEPEPLPDSYFSKFVEKLSRMVSEEETDEEFTPLCATFNDFVVEWPGNKITVDGEFRFIMQNLGDINLSFDVDVNYNGKDIDLGFANVDHTAYIAIQDLLLKQSFVCSENPDETDISTLLNKVYDYFFDLENEDGLQIQFNLFEILGLTNEEGKFDISGLLSGAGDLTGGLSINEIDNGDEAIIELGISLDEESDPINLAITLGKENVDLRKVDLGTINFGDTKISGALDCIVSKDVKLLGLDHPEYHKQRGKFTEIVSYIGFVDDIYNLLNDRTVGFDLDVDLRLNEDGNITNLGYLDADVDLDISRLFDLKGLNINDLINGKTEAEAEGYVGSASSITDALNDIDVNLHAKLGNTIEDERVEYSNINLAYFKNSDDEHAGYLAFNDDAENPVLKAKIDTETVNFLINEVPEIIKSIDKSEPVELDEIEEQNPVEETEGLFDFLLKSEVVTSIQEGHYEVVLDLLETLKSHDGYIEVVVNLEKLGLGEGAKVRLLLDSREVEEGEKRKVVSIETRNVKMGNIELDLALNTRGFDSSVIPAIDLVRDSYDKLDFVKGAFNQVKKIIDTTEASFTLSGSILDENELGFTFDGWTQLDWTQQNGVGSIKFDQFTEEAGVLTNDHKIDLSIDDFGSDHTKNNMFFQYSNPKHGNNSPLRGQFSLKTFDDLFELVTELVDPESEHRITGFIGSMIDVGSVSEGLAGGIISDILASKDYVQFTKSSFLKRLGQSNDGKSLDLVIAKELIPGGLVESDIHLQVAFTENEYDERIIDQIKIVDLVVSGTHINVEIGVKEYDPELENPVDLKANFYDFSEISTLLRTVINTSDLQYFHIQGTAKVSAASIININLNLDAHVSIAGDRIRAYVSATFTRTRIVVIVPISYSVTSEFLFDQSTEEGVDDYFYISRSEKSTSSRTPTTYYYKADSVYFGENLIDYLLACYLGFDIAGLIPDEESPTVYPAYEQMLVGKGFEYTHGDNGDKWEVGIDLGLLTGNSMLSPINATLGSSIINDNNYISSIKGDTGFVNFASVKNLVKLSVDLKLVDIDPAYESWPTNIEDRFNKVKGYYDTLSASNQAKAYDKLGDGYKFSGSI